VLRFRVTNEEGRRVERTLPVGLVTDFPKESDAWWEVDKQGLGARINDVRALAGRVSFHSLAEHYLKADFGADAVRPKSVNTTVHAECVVRHYLVPRFGNEIAEDIKPLDIQRWLKSLRTEKDLAWDDHLENARHYAAHLQGRDRARVRLEEPGGARRDALKERLPRHLMALGVATNTVQ
jgi:hypothetical protein